MSYETCVCGKPILDKGYYVSGYQTFCQDCWEQRVRLETRDFTSRYESTPPLPLKKRRKKSKSGRCEGCGESYKELRLREGLCYFCRKAEGLENADED